MLLNSTNKNLLRNAARLKRSNLDIKNISKEIIERVKNEDIYINAKNILAYYSFGDEIDITKLFEDKTKHWHISRLNFQTKLLTFYPYELNDPLQKNQFGIPEPVLNKEKTCLDKVDLIIIPALSADKSGTRLGYGAGFFDRFLATIGSRSCKMLVIPDQLISEKLPNDSWDIPIDLIVTQSETIKV
jgi:5-formyltetrahydrofolate cyclo-ligase